MPRMLRRRMGAWVMSTPHMVIVPPDAGSRPDMAYTSSLWPLPSMPAMQTISPACTWKLTFLTALFLWTLEGTVRFFTSRTTSAGCASPLVTANSTSRPTIIRDSSALVVSAMFTVPMYLPLRRTEQRSATAMISLSLWEIKRMDFPSAARLRIICSSSWISWGVSTAVGSSKIRISLSRYSIFRISVRCCIPTEMSSISASGSTRRPYFSDSAMTFSRARAR